MMLYNVEVLVLTDHYTDDQYTRWRLKLTTVLCITVQCRNASIN